MRRVPSPKHLPYPGGKSARNQASGGVWINRLLPHRERYFEPFVGMGGVLLSRPPSEVEVVNDLDGRVSNWWEQVRDNGGRLEEMMAATPRYSRPLFDRARNQDLSAGLTGAYYFSLMLIWSFNSIVNERARISATWALEHSGHLPRSRDPSRIDWAAITARMRGVCVENMDAVELLRKTAPLRNAVIYCDPPYPSAPGLFLYREKVDAEELGEVLVLQEGAVAVSGYGGEWDHLGWRRNERKTYTGFGHNTREPRTEVLWTNFKPGDYCEEPSLFE